MRRSPSLNAEAVGELFITQGDGLLVFFARRTFDAQIAVDLVAETFAQAVASRHRFRGTTDAEAVAWLYAIARHQLSAYWRTGQIELRALRRLGVERPQVLDEELAAIEERADVVELRETVADGLRQLSSQQREALQLRVVEELPYDTVASRLGVSEPTARARVSRALRRLHAVLQIPVSDISEVSS